MQSLGIWNPSCIQVPSQQHRDSCADLHFWKIINWSFLEAQIGFLFPGKALMQHQGLSLWVMVTLPEYTVTLETTFHTATNHYVSWHGQHSLVICTHLAIFPSLYMNLSQRAIMMQLHNARDMGKNRFWSKSPASIAEDRKTNKQQNFVLPNLSWNIFSTTRVRVTLYTRSVPCSWS